ncbi:MAG: putative AAA+ superfamily ATPase [Candidatus Omnitrophota bacterium]|jgi:predicted AAA+ superfamily ATPase
MAIIQRQQLQTIKERFDSSQAVAILGPRQCGKSTLARQYLNSQKRKVHFFDLENPQDLAQLDNPLIALESLNGLIVIDEIQRSPELFPVLRVLLDNNKKNKYLILGSASRELIKQSSETLAGRISYIEIGGFCLDEVQKTKTNDLWLRGGFPRSFLAKNNATSTQWRSDFISSFLERDIPNLGFDIPPRTLRKLWTMLSHYHGQLLNSSEIGKSMNLSHNTIRKYLDILSGTYVIRQLHPWFYNTKKRLIKAPKIYVRDSGLLHNLLTIDTKQQLVSNPKCGSSWEGFALEQVIHALRLRDEDVFFWGVHEQAELDMVFKKSGNLYGVEFKFQDAPRMTSSIQSALKSLPLKHIWVVYPGAKNYALGANVSVISINSLQTIRTHS